MTTFDDREHAFEAKFAQDAEMNFKAFARRDRSLGRWAAELLGKNEEDAREYVISLVREDVDDPVHEAALRKLVADLDGIADETAIRAKMAEFLVQAKSQLANGE